ncbi:MAG TPA: M6 family metalloprotease domain-containing protein [Longimicrobiales bacterium]|nr:M6 family metalloprotease domain-containing protein [Longimicrobiales bacterium]
MARINVIASASQHISMCALVGSGWESHTQRPFAQSAAGELKVIMLFVDFPDAPASESTSALYALLIPTAQDWFSEVSLGRFRMSVDRVDQWFRVAQPSGTYNWRTYAGHHEYISQVTALADPTVDFSEYDAVFIVAANGAAQVNSNAFHASPGFGVMLDGAEIRSAVTFGTGARSRVTPGYGAFLTVHETGHLLGLPDLYLFNASTWLSSHAAVGMWDPMGWLGLGTHFVSWHKWKLGWLDEARVDCLGRATVERVLVPFDAPSGTQVLVIPLASTTATIVEVRRETGFDAPICEGGVLVYSVNTDVATGLGPIWVQSARADQRPDLSLGGACGPLYESSYGLGPDRISVHSGSSGLTLEIIEVSADEHRVRVTRN